MIVEVDVASHGVDKQHTVPKKRDANDSPWGVIQEPAYSSQSSEGPSFIHTLYP